MNIKKQLRRPRTLKAFTLLEMIVVMAIIGILASIVVPSTIESVRGSKIETANTRAEEIYMAAQNFLTDRQIKSVVIGKSGKAGILINSDVSGTWTVTNIFGDTTFDDDNDSKQKFKEGISNYIGSTTMESLTNAAFFVCFDVDTYTAEYVLYCEDGTMLNPSTGIITELTKDGKKPYTQVFGFPTTEVSGAGVTPRSQEYDTNKTNVLYVGQYPVGK